MSKIEFEAEALVCARAASDLLLRAANAAACVDSAFEKALDDLQDGVAAAIKDYENGCHN